MLFLLKNRSSTFTFLPDHLVLVCSSSSVSVKLLLRKIFTESQTFRRKAETGASNGTQKGFHILESKMETFEQRLWHHNVAKEQCWRVHRNSLDYTVSPNERCQYRIRRTLLAFESLGTSKLEEEQVLMGHFLEAIGSRRIIAVHAH